MPISTHPNAKINYVLKVDRDLPEKDQPVFIMNALSARKTIELKQLQKKYTEAKDEEEVLIAAINMLDGVLIGWQNMDKDFSMEALKETCSVDEITELIYAAIASQIPGIEDKKKSQSRLPSPTANSARHARAAKRAKKT